MILTDEKIVVTDSMMSRAGMTRYNEYGVPVDPKDKSKGLTWKNLASLTEEDFDKIEEYFLFGDR